VVFRFRVCLVFNNEFLVRDTRYGYVSFVGGGTEFFFCVALQFASSSTMSSRVRVGGYGIVWFWGVSEGVTLLRCALHGFYAELLGLEVVYGCVGVLG
jgi:hypothetical protein